MLVELIFNRNDLTLDAGQVKEKIEDKLGKLDFGRRLQVESVTVMSRWLVVLVDFPELTEHPREVEHIFDGVAGTIVLELIDYGVRYRHWEIHGEGESLIFKKDWRGDVH